MGKEANTDTPAATGVVGRSALLELTRKPRRYRTVDIDGVGSFRLQALTGDEQAAYERSLLSRDGKPKGNAISEVRVRLLARTLVDETGNRMFADSKEDRAALAKLPAFLLTRLVDAAQELNGVGDSDLDELAGN